MKIPRKVLAIGTLAALASSGCDRSAASIVFSSGSMLDLGLVDPNCIKKLEFPFRVKGDEFWRCTGVVSGCGCTDTHFSKDWMSPGEVGGIRATINVGPGGRAGVAMRATFESRDGKTEDRRLEVAFKVYQAVRFDPPSVMIAGGLDSIVVKDAFAVYVAGSKAERDAALQSLAVQDGDFIIRLRSRETYEVGNETRERAAYDLVFSEGTLSVSGRVRITHGKQALVLPVVVTK